MKSTLSLTGILVLALLSCTDIDKTSHVSYKELTAFLMSKNVSGKFDIQKIKVDEFSLSDSTHLESGHKTYRKLIANYGFTLIGKQKDYLYKAVVTSSDSINWQLTQLSIIDKSIVNKTTTEHAYNWDFTKSFPNQHTDLVTIVTEE